MLKMKNLGRFIQLVKSTPKVISLFKKDTCSRVLTYAFHCHELFIIEVYRGSVAGHYGENKTLTMLGEHYY